MHETVDMGIADELTTARALVDEGEQGAARALLLRTLADAVSARDGDEAYAIAEATAVLIELDIDIEPAATIDHHLARMDALTSGFDDARTSEARALAELHRVEFIHGHTDLDPVLHVEVLHRALAFDEKFRSSRHVGVRRAAAEAALTAQMIRRWLEQDPATIAVALDELAVRLGGETDPRMVTIRLDAIIAASRSRIDHGLDLTGVAEVLRIAVDEGRGTPEAEGRGMDASLLLADLAIADGVAPVEAVALARELLEADVEPRTLRRTILAARHLGRILERLDPDSRDAVSGEEWPRLLDRNARVADAEVRSAMLSELLSHVGPVADVSASGLALLRYADRLFDADVDPDSAVARFAVAAKIAGALGHPDDGSKPRHPASFPRDAAESVRLSIAAENRFASLWDRAETVPAMAALILDRALRESDLGERHAAIDTLSRLIERVRTAGHDIARLETAQAAYWLSRFLRESGEPAASRRIIDETLREYGDDPSADVRLWAANTLWSAWRAAGVDDDEARHLQEAFAERFADDRDVRIRRLDATRRLNESVVAHESGDAARAVAGLTDLVQRFGEDEDGDIRDTVRRARENLHILHLGSTATPAADAAATARYRSLRDRLYSADDLAERGQVADAARVWQSVVDETAGSEDVDVAMLRLAALDSWAGWLQDAGHWHQVIELAHQATIIRAGADQRAERVQARAYLRLGLALGHLDRPGDAIAAYEALDDLASGSHDGDVTVARQQAVYNRAVTIDDLGDGAAALTAYEHVIAVHAQAVDSASGRLRCAKALRNQALIFAGLGRTAEAAASHRRVLDLGAGSSDPELFSRVKSSALDLAAAFSALGEHSSAASTYAWTLSHPQLHLSAEERRTAVRAEKRARRSAR